MKHSIWMTPWDLAGREPEELIAFLRGLGLDGCNLALSYHGGRMLLPANRCHTVYEQHASAVYFPCDAGRYAAPLVPAVGAEAPLAMRFLERAAAEGFPVYAWTVLCHNDYLGPLAPECCIENAFGERYSYALCPSHPEVRRYVAALCGEIAALPGVAGLDLEALGFLGYEHGSLHAKAGVALPREALIPLSICFCRYCRAAMGDAEEIAAAARDAVRAYLRDGQLPARRDKAVLAARRQAQLAALDAIRAATGSTPLNVRLSLDPWFFGGKATLAWDDLPRRADSVTLTYFGLPVDVANVPRKRSLPIHTGFVFHGPDCTRPEDVAARYRALRDCAPETITFYCFSMAAPRHFAWLRRTIQGAD